MNLFERLPPNIFGPLTGKNQRRTWDLLVRLSEHYFGPDAVPTHADGYLHEEITKEIERFLLVYGWDSEDERGVTPLNIQANEVLTRLVATGWLTEDRVGVRRFISMRPIVSRFFELLQQFAIEGPQLVSGNIQLVHNQLKSVVENPRAQAAGFVEAAKLCVRLINSLNATTLRARDLMKELTLEQATPVFVKRFFTEHIADLYVRDFKQLRTENHPLRLRFDIIELVSRVAHEEPARSELLHGYRDLPGARAGEETEQLDRDVDRFRRLLDVEKFLERMDRVMEAATQRALAYLGYRLKASERIEEVIVDTLQALQTAEAVGEPIEGRLLSPLPIVAEHRLQMPAPAPQKPVRKPMVKREMTVMEHAMHLLRKEMIAHRDVTPMAIKRYVTENLPPAVPIHAKNLPMQRVEDAVAFVVLMRIASITKYNPHAAKNNPLMRRLGFTASMSADGARVDTELFNTADFTIVRGESDA